MIPMENVPPPARRALGLVLAVALSGSLAIVSGCASAPPAPLPAPSPPNLFEAHRAVAEYIDSGRYEADVAKVTEEARRWLESRAKAVARPALVLDIDETSLSNWPAYRANGWGRVVNGPCDVEKGPCGLRAWQASGMAKAIAPTLALARRAHELGVAVFFVSGRPPALHDVTERNLREQGYPVDGVVVFPEGAAFTSAVDFKAPERRKLVESGYTILAAVGDQQSDLDGGYAERTFKLPNPVYFLP